jgi:hypothetical protein
MGIVYPERIGSVVVLHLKDKADSYGLRCSRWNGNFLKSNRALEESE